MAASIVVDIKAKISGYEQEIERIKSLLKNIKVDSSIGKELTRDLKAVEQEVNNLAKHITQKFSSESQISGFTDKLNQLDERFVHIGESMSNVKAENLDFSKVDEQFAHLIEEIDTIKASLNEKIETGFSSAVSESENLNKAFKRLKLDITGLSSTEVGEALTSNLEAVQQSISDSTNRIKELKGEIKSLETTRDNLSNKPILQMPNATQASKDILGDKKDLGITGQVNQNFLKEFTDKINSTLESAKPEIQKKKDEINKILESIGQVSSFEEMKTKLEELKKELTGTGTWTSLGLDSNKLGQTAKNLFSEVIDPQQVEDGLKQVKEKLQAYSLSDEEINKIIPNVKENLLSGNFEKAKETIRKNLEEIKTLTEKEINEITEKINNLNTERADLMKQRRSDKYTQGLLTKAQDEYGDIIKQLQDENKQLSERVKALEDQLKTGRENTLNNIKSGGRDTKLKAGEGLRENIENAQIYQSELQKVQEKEKLIGKIEGVVQRWFSVYAAVRMVGQAIRSVISTVQELDKTITQIAIVTNMTQDQLWGQMQSYTDMARQYATSISGVYEVSQLYYQQGLQTADVMALTEETLKMARISGLDYATATDYMTNAVRSFKMEMTDAQTVVDVYSEIAASSATSTSELATAMSKTASSAQAVGASFENTTAMMAVMIEATRESAENIGSAMKSIISRYGEMTKDPSKLTDSEGEEMSLNKVDKALQTVGISIHNAEGQFRDFDDVITELAGKWDTIDKNTQRYIATVMAGNRQQSRFLALVSNGERLSELTEKAANSQDAATLQVLKTMDSIEAKTQQLKTTLQSLYVESGVEKSYKNILDFANNIVKSLTEMGTVAGIPVAAIGKIGLTFMSLSNTVVTAFGLMRNRVKLQLATLNGELTAQENIRQISVLNMANKEVAAIAEAYEQRIVNAETMQARLNQLEAEGVETRINLQNRENSPKSKALSKGWAIGGAALSLAGTAISGYAANLDVEKDRQKKAVASGIGTMAQLTGLGASMGGVWGAAAGAGIGAIAGAVQALGIATEETEEKVTRLGHAVEETSNKKLQSKDNLQTLVDYKKKYDELAATRNKDAESREEWIKLNNDIAASYPELISQMDAEGNKIVDMTDAYQKLADAKLNAYKNDFLSNTAAELGAFSDLDYVLKNIYGVDPIESQAKSLIGLNFDQAPEIVGGLLQNNLPKSLSPQSINHLFGAGYTIDTGSGERVDTKYAQSTFIDILDEFNKLAENNISFIDAQDQLKEQFGSEYESAITNFDDTIYEALQAGYSAIEFQDTIVANKITSANQEWINIISQMANMDVSDLQKDVMADQMAKEWETYYKENKDKIQTITNSEGIQEQRKLEPDELYQEFLKRYQVAWINKFLLDNQELNNEVINELYKDIGKSTASDIVSDAGKYAGLSDEVRRVLLERFHKEYDDTINNFKDNINNLMSTTKNIDLQSDLDYIQDEFSSLFGPEYLEGISAQFEKILNNTGISDNNKHLQLSGLTEIYSTISTLDQDLQQIALSAAEGADFTSLVGIYDFIDSLENAGINLDATGLRQIIREFGQTLSLNFETEVQSYIAKVTSGMEDFDKALNSASKGMDFKAASELANKLGKSLTEDFDLRDGQYFFSDFAAIRDHFIQANDEYLADLEKAQKKELENFDKIKPGISIKKGEEIIDNRLWKDFNTQEELDNFLSSHQQAIEDFTGLDISTISNAWQQWHQQAAEGENDFVDWLTSEYEKQFNEATEAGKTYANQRMASIALSAGKIDSFLSIYDELGKEIDADFAKSSFEKGDIDKLVSTFPEYAQTIIDTYSSISEGIYNKILSDTSADKYVNATDINRPFLDKLVGEGIAKKISDTVYKLADITEIEIDKYFSIINNDSNLNDTEKAQARAEATKALYEQSKDKLISDVIKDIESVDASVAEMFRQTYGEDAFNNVFESLGDGTYKVDLAALKDAINIDELNEQTQRAIVESVQSTADNVIKQLSTATSLISKGTTSPKEMQEFVTKFNEVTGESVRIQDIFSYDKDLDGFVLANEALNNFVIKQREALQELGLQQTEIQAYLQENFVDPIAATIDFDTILSSEQGSEASIKAHQAFYKAVRNYNTALLAMADEGEEVVTLNARALMDAIKMGGSAAVQAAQTITSLQGKTLTAQQVEELYRREVSELVNAIDTVVAKPGEIVDATTASIIGFDNVEALGTTGQYVVQSAANLYEAYTKLLKSLEATGEATLADLNKVAALALENRDGEQAAIDALGDAAGMTFTRFGEILADAGIQLTETMINDLETSGIIDLIGGNKMRIADFSRFADLMGWDANSEEYISAFKTYNDSLIEMNRKAENNILEEVNALGDAKGGDWLNLTQLSERLETALEGKIVNKGAYDVPAFDNFINILNDMGGHLQDGILKLDSDANIPGILTTIASYAQQYGGLLQSDMAQLADTLDSVLQSYVDAISKGINGKLSNSDAFNLQQMVDSLDMNVNLEFTKTAEGMKLTKQSAIELYQELQKIDSLKAQLVFDDLYDSLTGDLGSGFNNMADTMATVTELQNKITKNQEKMAEISDQMQHGDASEKDIARLGILERQTAELEKQLDLAQEIATKQAGDPDSYNFMNGKLPDYLQGPANYWDSVGKAYKTMNEAASAGTIDLTDYYNIVNEMSNLAAMSGQLEVDGQQFASSAEMASYLIEKGANALTNIDGEGVKVDLSRLGVNFVTGANNMEDNFQTGIKAMADSQIAMLDAAIQMMETVVAMEKLGDIDVDNNGIFSIGDIFKDSGSEDNGDFTEEYYNWADNILELADDGKHEDLQNALNNITVNGHTMRELIEAAKKAYEGDTTAWEELNISEQDYFAVMEAFVKAAENGDYDLDNILSSVQDILSNTLIDGTNIDTGVKNINFSGGSSFTIDWESDNGEKAIEQAKKDHPELAGDEEALRQKLQEAFTAYQKGKATSVQVVETLVAKGLIKLNVEEGTIELPDGSTVAADSATGQAAIAEAVSKDAGIENGQAIYDENKNFVTYEGEITVGSVKIKTRTDANGNVQYISGETGKAYNSPKEVMNAEKEEKIEEFRKNLDPKLSGSEKQQKIEEYTQQITSDLEIKYGFKVNPKVEVTNEEDLKNRTQEEVNTLAQSLVNGTDEEVVNAAKEIGIEVNVEGELTAEDRAQIAELAGITSETKALNVAIAVSGDGADTVKKLLNDEASANLTVNVATEIPGGDINLIAEGLNITTEGIEPTLDRTDFTITDPVTATGTAGSLELTAAGIEATLAEGNPIKISGAIDSTGTAGTLTITLNEGQNGELEHTGDIDVGSVGNTTGNSEQLTIEATNKKLSEENPDVGQVGSITGTSNDAKINATSYQITFVGENGSSNTVVVNGTANLVATLAQYGVGFDANGNLTNVGKYNVDIEPNDTNVDLTTTANMDGAEAAVNTWAANKVVQIQVKTASVDGATTEVEADPILATELKNVTDFDSLSVQIQVSGAENGISTLEQYKAKIQEVLDAGQQLNSIDLTNVQTLSAAGLIDINLPTATSTIDNLEITGANNATYDGTLTLTEDISEGQGNISNLTVGATNLTANSGLAALQGMDFSTTSSSLLGVQQGVGKISRASFSNFSDLSGMLEVIKSQVESIWDTVKQFANQTFTVTLQQQSGTTNTDTETTENKTVNTTQNTTVNVDTSGAQGSAKALSTAAASMGASLTVAATKVKNLATAATKIPNKAAAVQSLASAIKDIPSRSSLVSNLASAMKQIPDVASRVKGIADALNRIPTSKSFSMNVSVNVKATGAGTGEGHEDFEYKAKGNVALSKGTGPALASGRKTLVGELGPELVVSGGKYYVVGQHGAEFVDLAPDAIVFNHLQTRELLKHGSSSRGDAVTSEKNAVALAGGTSGPAMASASAALSALKQLRAMWESLATASAKDLGALAGRGGKGGGGGGGCFVAGTPIATRNGFKNIEDIEVGDIVLSYNEETGKNEYSEVLQTMIHDVEEDIYTLHIEDEELVVTGIHRFLIGNEWIPASALATGNLVRFADGTLHAISEIDIEEMAIRVYNFEVSNNHNYYVGNNSILAHNKGGGGGGGGGADDNGENRAVTAEIQRWYNLTRQIAKAEKDITYQQALRSKYQSDFVVNGDKIYATYQKELAILRKEVRNQKELVELQKSWYDAKRKELEASDYGKIFTYDENGLQQYVGSGAPGSGRGLDILEKLNERDVNGQPINNAKSARAQLKYLRSVGFNLSDLLYNDDGTKAAKSINQNTLAVKKNNSKDKKNDIYVKMMENFWNNIDGWRDELDNLYDSYNDTLTNIEENQTKQNEILQELRDNELDIEQELLKAIESREQAAIDEKTDLKDALKDASDAYISGLSEALDKERKQYEQNQGKDELTKLQRQLAILQRSGGSASQIRSLQEQISGKQRDVYFDERQSQIDAIQEASDKEIEALEREIDIMNETLEYQKDHGLFWPEIRKIMSGQTAEQAWNSILAWDSEMKNKSALDIDKTAHEFMDKFTTFAAKREQDKAWNEDKTDIKTSEDKTKYSNLAKDSNAMKAAQESAMSAAEDAYRTTLSNNGTREEAKRAAQKAYDDEMASQSERHNRFGKSNQVDEETRGILDSTSGQASSKLFDNVIANAMNDKKSFFYNPNYKGHEEELRNAFVKNMVNDHPEVYNEDGELIDDWDTIQKAAQDSFVKAGKQVEKDNALESTNGNIANEDTQGYTFKKTTVNGKKRLVLKKGETYGTDVQITDTKLVEKTYYTAKGKKKKEQFVQAKVNGKTVYFKPGDITNISEPLKAAVTSDALEDQTTVEKANALPVPPLALKLPNSLKANQVDVNNENTSVGNKVGISGFKYNKKGVSEIKVATAGNDGSIQLLNEKIFTIKKGKNRKYLNKQLLKKNKKGKYIPKDKYVSYTKYVQGGLADYTGPAWVDGTPKKPEAFLNAAQTQFVRNDLLGNSKTSLVSIVSALQDAISNTATSPITNNSNAVSIGNVNLTIESGVIANDYDARRAGSNITDEILKIAKKSGNLGISRR